MSDVKPALTAEEWAADNADVLEVGPGAVSLALPDPEAVRRMGRNANVWRRHALAARCLHGQPFGFTREDVRLCEWAMTKLRALTDSPDDWGDLKHLADRLEALLPPEAP